MNHGKNQSSVMRIPFYIFGSFGSAIGLCLTLSGRPATAGSALAFDGVDDYVSFGTGLFPTVTNTFTIELWVKPAVARAITSEGTAGIPGNSGQRYAIFPEQGQIAYGNNTHAGAGVSVGTNGIGVFEHSADYLPSPLVFVGTFTDWQHIAVVYSNRTPRLYVNGLLRRTGLTSGKTVHPSINLGVAGSGYGYYQGTLDEVRVWSVALDADTLQQWRGYEPDPSHPAYGHLVGYWKLDEGAGVAANDASGKAHPGTLQNGPTWVTPGAPVNVLSNPVVVTTPISELMDTSARLAGSVNPRGSATYAWFEWGTSTNYGFATAPVAVGAGETAVAVSELLTALAPATRYYYRVVATNSLGMSRASGREFRTTGPPTVVTLSATEPSVASAWMWGTLVPNDLASWVWFEWGTNTEYGNLTPPQAVAPGIANIAVSNLLTGLSVGAEYHYRLQASNSSGMAVGLDQSFHTLTFSNVYFGIGWDTHGAVSWQDYERDGDLDLLTVSGARTNGFTTLYRSETNAWSVVPPLPYSWGPSAGLPWLSYGSASWGDYDNDGDADLLLSGEASTQMPYDSWRSAFVNRNQSGNFTNVFTALTPFTHGAAVWADYDKDGRLDFFASGDAGSDVYSRVPTNGLFHNNGNGTFSRVASAVPAVFDSSIAWGDADNDGDLDLLIAGNTGTAIITRLFLNQAGVFTDSGQALPGVASGSVAWGDYDNDGWPDILLGGSTNANTSGAICRIYRNNHDGTFSDIGANLPGLYQAYYAWWGDYVANAAWGDYDGDGQLDVLLCGVATNAGPPAARIYRNDHGVFTDIGTSLADTTGGAGAWGDYDGDGSLDLALIGNRPYYGTTTLIYRNFLSPPSDPPERPTTPSATDTVVINDSVTLTWTAASDPHTPAPGLTYNVRVGTNSGGGQIVAPHSDPITGRRRLPQMGNAEGRLFSTLTNLPLGQYFWSVHAVNHGFVGSPWAAERSFVVTNGPALVATLAASNVLCCSATLHGSVVPGGTTTTVWFEWGVNGNLNLSTTSMNVGPGLQPLPVQQALPGLQPLTAYSFRLVASNSAGLVMGANASFTTALPAPVVTTLGASNVLWTSAGLFGSSPLASPGADYFIEWGATVAYGSITPAAIQDAALHFDGVDDCVEVGWGKFPGVTNNFTIEMWVNPTAARSPTTESTSGAAGTGGQRYALFPEQGSVAYGGSHAGVGLSVGTNGISVMEHTGGALPSVLVYNSSLAGWNHVALVYSNHVPRLYVNGALARTGLIGSLPAHPSAAFGGVTDPTWAGMGPFAGELQELRIWDQPLDAAMIQAWMNQTVTTNHPAHPHLSGYWPLTEGRGASLTDSSPGNNSGQLLNGAAWTGGRQSSARVFRATPGGLAPGTTYHFRAVAINAGGTAYGDDQTFATLPRPSVLGVTRQSALAAAGSLLQFSGSPMLNYTLETSTNLVNWFALTNLLAGADGRFEFLDTSATNFPTRFYRLRVP